jgi:tripartite-type tricarboxylate transporter receptor subunit TctC
MGALGLAGASRASTARAQDWPSRPIRLIIPWPPGQATDLANRVFAQQLSQRLGQPVVAENRAGAGGMIGTDAVAKSTADGYTLLAASAGPITTNPLLQRVSYDPERDFAPIGLYGLSAYQLVVRPNFPAQTMQEFLAEVRRNPGRYSYASSGTGATAHLVSLMLHSRAGLQSEHIPFQGTAPGITAVAAGQVDYAVETVVATKALVQNGSLRALGVSLAGGSAYAPGVPPFASVAGLEGFHVGGWIGLMAPAATPKPILDRLASELEQAMRTPEVRERFSGISLEVESVTGEAFVQYLKEQRELFRQVVEANNIRLD